MKCQNLLCLPIYGKQQAKPKGKQQAKPKGKEVIKIIKVKRKFDFKEKDQKMSNKERKLSNYLLSFIN